MVYFLIMLLIAVISVVAVIVSSVLIPLVMNPKRSYSSYLHHPLNAASDYIEQRRECDAIIQPIVSPSHLNVL